MREIKWYEEAYKGMLNNKLRKHLFKAAILKKKPKPLSIYILTYHL